MYSCLRANEGYFLTTDPDGTYNGGFQKCNAPCLTCTSNPNYCLSCLSGYSIDGFSCFNKKQVDYSMKFNYPGYFNDGDSFDYSYARFMGNFLGFRGLLCKSFPALITKNDAKCLRNFSTKKCRRSSVIVDLSVDASNYNSAAAAQNAMTSMTVPGISILSTSASAQGFSDSSSSSTNLGLILGVSIPLGILRNYFAI